MAAEKFCQRIHDDVRTVIYGPQQDRRRNSVVDDERNTLCVGYTREALDVADISGGVADALAENRARFVVDQFGNRFGLVALRKADGDSLAWQNMCEECVRGAVKLWDRNNVAAQLSNIQH